MMEASGMGKRWDIKRLPLILPFLLLLLGSCVTLPGRIFDIGSDDRRAVFTPLISKSFDARSQTPTVGTQDARALVAAGYATIGRLEVVQVIERCEPKGNVLSCQNILQPAPLSEDFLKEAARNGGDLILLEQEGQKKGEEFSRRGKCLLWGEMWRYESYPVQKHRIGGTGLPSDYTTVFETRLVRVPQCQNYEILAGKATTVTTSGTVWRKDALLANAQRLNSEYIYAVTLGRLQQVKELLALGLDVNTRNIDGDLVLGVAAVFGRNEIVTALLDAGADVNATDLFGSALHRAVANGHFETAKLLIDRKANVSVKHTQARYPWKGLTPIFEAAKNGKTDLIRLLIEHGAKAEETTEEGMSPLMMAAMHGHTEAIRTLIRSKAKVDVYSKPLRLFGGADKYSPLLVAIMRNHLEAVMVLLSNGAKPTEIDIAMAYGKKEFTEVVAIHERVSKVKTAYGFIDAKGDFALLPQWVLAESFSEGLAAVHVRLGHCGYIDRNGQLAIEPRFNYCKNFSEGLAAVMVPSKGKGEKALYGYVDRTGNLVIPAKFENAGEFSSGVATIHIKDESGKSTLKVIDRNGRFVTSGAVSQPIKEKSSHPPRESLSVKLFLIDDYPTTRVLYGYVDTNGRERIAPQFFKAKPFWGGFAAVLAPVENVQDDISRWREILSSFTLNRDFRTAVLNGNVQIASSLMEKGGRIEGRNRESSTYLHLATYEGHPAMARFLLDRGADVNAQGLNGKTALMIAAEKNNAEMARMLLQQGADPNIRDDMNLTPREKADLLGNKLALSILEKAEKAMKK